MYYKVTNRLLESAVCQHSRRVKYEINSWTKPPLKEGPLFVFSNFNAANDNFGKSKFFRIFECEIVQELESYKDWFLNFHIMDIDWELEDVAFASAVKLIKEVK